jgi:5'-methylthioadenosine phosphorylase
MRRTSRVSVKPEAQIGIIGGSGLYEMEGLTGLHEVRIKTAFGPPSDAVMIGEIEGIPVAFLSRHGRGHLFSPTEINFRANILAMKLLGVQRILSVSAVGSMKEKIHPGHLVIADQFVDLTKHRISTFFGDGVVAHVSFADPTCPELRRVLAEASRPSGATIHEGGVYLCIEGPQFSTRGESRIYRQWGVDVIGMTNATEAKLAREAEICYATLALATDYDCWYEGEEAVSVGTVIQILHRNVETAKRLIRMAVPKIPSGRNCSCAAALKNAIITATNQIPKKTKDRLKPLLEKYLKR